MSQTSFHFCLAACDPRRYLLLSEKAWQKCSWELKTFRFFGMPGWRLVIFFSHLTWYLDDSKQDAFRNKGSQVLGCGILPNSKSFPTYNLFEKMPAILKNHLLQESRAWRNTSIMAWPVECFLEWWYRQMGLQPQAATGTCLRRAEQRPRGAANRRGFWVDALLSSLKRGVFWSVSWDQRTTPKAPIFNARERQGGREVESLPIHFSFWCHPLSNPLQKLQCWQDRAMRLAHSLGLPLGTLVLWSWYSRFQTLHFCTSGSSWNHYSNTHPVRLCASSTVFFSSLPLSTMYCIVYMCTFCVYNYIWLS